MQGTIRCVKCNHENPAGQINCLRCGEYLGRNKSQKRKKTIWEINDSAAAGKSAITPAGDEDVVVCPQCLKVTAVDNGMLPLFCGCGYSFDIIADKIIKRSEAEKIISSGNDTGNNGISDSAEKTERKDDICNTHGNDVGHKGNTSPGNNDSILRLKVDNADGHKPEEVAPSGGVIGKNGTVLKDLSIQTQIKISRAPTGWYAEVLSGEAVIEGYHVNRQIERQLENGNLISVDGYYIFVEITEAY
ncbi:MAG: hypothetical protein K6G22_09040 [Lachnospiraceae bacterium]|nr:hypothetical protein [Lachnospiraceae bacterium]